MGTIIIKDVPEDVKRKFKALCVLKGKTLREELIRLMKEEIEKSRKDGL